MVNSTPLIHLNGVSAFMQWQQGAHRAQQKNTVALWQEVQPHLTFAEMQPDIMPQQWSITYMQANILGGLFCNLNTVFGCLPHDHRTER